MDDKKLASLARRAIEGDIDAFEEVYLEYARSVLFHVRNQIIDKENYQEVAQDVAVTLWKNIKQLRKPMAFRGWMHQIIRTTCVNHNRTLLKERAWQSADTVEDAIDSLSDLAFGESSDPSLLTVQKDDGHRLFQAIESLPPAYRDAIILRYYDDLTYKEIAEALDVSTSSVGTNIMRGVEHLKKIFIGQDDEDISQALQRTIACGQESGEAHKPSNHKRSTMDKENAEKKGIQASSAVAGAFIINAETIKSSLNAGVNKTISTEAVQLYTKEIHLSIMGIKAAAVTAAVPMAINTAGNVAITIATSIMAAFAIAVGAYGYSTAGLPEYLFWVSEEVLIETPIQYKGDPRIIFTDADGSNSPYEVVGIVLEDYAATPVSIVWTITSSSGEQVLSGKGAEISKASGLGNLSPGEYKADFELVDEEGATALCYRTFTVG